MLSFHQTHNFRLSKYVFRYCSDLKKKLDLCLFWGYRWEDSFRISLFKNMLSLYPFFKLGPFIYSLEISGHVNFNLSLWSLDVQLRNVFLYLKPRHVLEIKNVKKKNLTTEHRFWFEYSGHAVDMRGLETLNNTVRFPSWGLCYVILAFILHYAKLHLVFICYYKPCCLFFF